MLEKKKLKSKVLLLMQIQNYDVQILCRNGFEIRIVFSQTNLIKIEMF